MSHSLLDSLLVEAAHSIRQTSCSFPSVAQPLQVYLLGVRRGSGCIYMHICTDMHIHIRLRVSREQRNIRRPWGACWMASAHGGDENPLFFLPYRRGDYMGEYYRGY